jgi:glycosyltransferase involved in cell wall biosynthesis
MKLNFGFVSTRFAGTDGVSLEASKWADVLQQGGHHCFWFAGELDRPPGRCYLMPKAHFQHPKIQWINRHILGRKGRASHVTETIHAIRAELKTALHRFIQKHAVDVLVVQNALTIPMNVPLGLALAETIAETEIPTLAHHHDFYWERVRFAVNGVNDYLRMAFPPNLPNILHVVINSEAQENLALRTGITSTIVPNVLDFDNPPLMPHNGDSRLREIIGLAPDDIMILQPTRIVQRKGIEHAIQLVKELKNPRCKLVISHKAGDEGFEYAQWLQQHACEHGVSLRVIEASVGDPWSCRRTSPNQFSLWDVYPHADFVTFPSISEGFGNAFLEAIYFKKPLLINRYATFVRDIEPLGFDLVVMDGLLTRSNVQQVRTLIQSGKRTQAMTTHNYQIARQFYSYTLLRSKITSQVQHFYGAKFSPLTADPSAAIKETTFTAQHQPAYQHFPVSNCKHPSAS